MDSETRDNNQEAPAERSGYSRDAVNKAQRFVQALFPIANNLLASAIQGTGKIPETDDPIFQKALEAAEMMVESTEGLRKHLLEKFQAEVEAEADRIAPTARKSGLILPENMGKFDAIRPSEFT